MASTLFAGCRVDTLLLIRYRAITYCPIPYTSSPSTKRYLGSGQVAVEPSGDSVELGAIIVQSSIADQFHCSPWSSRPNRGPQGWMVTRGSTLGQPGRRVRPPGREVVRVGRDPTRVGTVRPGSPVKPSGVCPLPGVDVHMPAPGAIAGHLHPVG